MVHSRIGPMVPWMVLTMARVVVTKSWGGFLVLLELVVCAGPVTLLRSRQSAAAKALVLACGVAALGLGAWLGGPALMSRFNKEDLSEMTGRKLNYADAARMAQGFPLFYFYRNQSKGWAA